VIGKPVSILVPEDRQDEEPAILSRLRSGQRIHPYETIRQRKDGTLIEISITISPVTDSSGKIIGVSKIAREIGARKKAENANRYLAAMVESSDDAIITKDLNGIITSWNNGAQAIFGYTAEEAVGQPMTILMPPDRQDEEPNILARIRRGERIDHYETVRQRKDGSLVDISLTVSPVRDANGRVIGASKIARDISEMRKAREALARSREELEKLVSVRTASLQQALAQMEEFSYSVSHDLRAPARAIQGYAEAALEDFGERLDTDCRQYLQNILAGSARMEQLIGDVLTYSKLARSEIRLHPVSLEKLVPEIIRHYPEMQPPKAEITIRGPLEKVIGNESFLTQALSNLLSNAVKFIPQGAKPNVIIWTAADNGSIRIWIKDNGIGIQPKYQHRLFGMFERVHQNAKYEGTGIGLAIVRKAAEKMGGRVGVESDGTNGSSFWMELRASKDDN
jgi:PAS domain S-box-containing protein